MTTTAKQGHWMASPVACAVQQRVRLHTSEAITTGRESAITANEWGGWDFRLPSADHSPRTLRVCPIDGSFEYGAALYVLAGRGQVCESQMQMNGLTPKGVAMAAAAMAQETAR